MAMFGAMTIDQMAGLLDMAYEKCRNNPSNLAILILMWEDHKRLVDAVEDVIKEVVLELGETVKVGNVTASHYGGRTTYDYEGAAKDDESAKLYIPDFTTTTTTTNWRLVCEAAGIEAPVLKKSDPSVSLKLS